MVERKKVTDPALLNALNSTPSAPARRAKVTDPALLAALNGGQQSPAPLIDQASTNDPANELGIPVFNRPASADEQRAVRSQTIAKEYEALPWYGKAGQALDDTARLVVDGASLGFADRMDPTGAQRQMTEDARERAGWAGTVAEAAGALAPTGVVANAAGRAVRAAGYTPGLIGRTAGASANAAGYYAGSSVGHDQEITPTGLALSAGLGAAGNLAGEAIGAGVNKVAGLFNKRPNIPSVDDLKAKASAAYDRADAAGVILKPDPIVRLSNDVRTMLTDNGYHPQLQPRIATVLSEIDRVAQGNVTLKGLDQMRKIADTARASLDPSEKRLGSMIVEKIDDIAENLTPREVLTGNAQEGFKALNEARKAWRSVKKSEKVAEAVMKAERRAASTGSGGNVENATRQNIRAILDNQKARRGFTKDEIAAMERVVRGDSVQNAFRLVGKLSPSGNGLMAALGIGGAMVNPWLGAASLAGAGAKFVADRGAAQAVGRLEDLILAGGNAASLSAAPNFAQRIAQRATPLLGNLGALSGASVARENQ